MAKATAFGVTFDSQTERDRYLVLRSLVDSGVISDLEVQPGPFTLVDRFRDQWGKAWRAVKYTPDFAYTAPDGVRVVEEVKPDSRKARSWGREVQVKLKLLAQAHPDWRVRVWTPGDGGAA